MINFFRNIFIWWNRQTIGTMLYTLFFGKFRGIDEFGNKYYESKLGKRWVIYKNRIESSQIPPKWHMWIHFLTNNKPSDNLNKFKWQKEHEENLTGTNKAYKPDGALSSKRKKDMKKYETWKP